MTIEGETFSLSDILEQFRRKRYVQLSDGNRAILDSRYMGRLQRLFNRSAGKGRVKVSFFDLPELESLIQDKVSGDFARHAREVFFGFNSIGDNLPEGVAKAQFVMLQALNELRRIASVPESVTDSRVRSPKIEELVDSLSSAVGNGHKCLVFFNYIAGRAAGYLI